MMTVSVWSYDDLGPDSDHGVPDKNPSIGCAECGEKYPYQDYWKPRYVDPDDIDPREATWRCDGCAKNHRRQEENQSLSQFRGGR